MRLLRFVAALALLGPLASAQDAASTSGLVIHEWGTFTTVAGSDGAPVQWAPLSGTPDLPCFVDHLSGGNLKYSLGLVRMETPVLYFYSSSPLVASVHVGFPRCLITEWYPQASRVAPDLSGHISPTPVSGAARADWNSVQVSPSSPLTLPTTAGASRYFAAH